MKREKRIIRRIFDLYFRNILKQLPGEGDNVYIFLDEVQKISDWSEEVKSLHDRGYPVKFIVTGSSAMNIMRGSGESLVGRIDIRGSFHSLSGNSWNTLVLKLKAYQHLI